MWIIFIHSVLWRWSPPPRLSNRLYAAISDQSGFCGCVRSFVHLWVCLCSACELCVVSSSAFWLHVKPLHCSTATGISAGTALFFLLLPPLTLRPHNRGIKFGPDSSCVEKKLLLAHTCTSSSVHTPRSRGRRAAESSHKSPVGSPPPHTSPPPPVWVGGSISGGEPRVLETDTDMRRRERSRGGRENMESSGVSPNSAAVWEAAQ